MIEGKLTRGNIRLGTQSWPATALGAREFLRTQGRRAAWQGEIGEIWLAWCHGDEPGMTIQTSGTTGAPKTVLHSREAVVASARDTIQHWGLKPGASAVLALPTSFVAGRMMLIRSIEGAWDLEVVQPTAHPGWSGRVDFAALTPHQAKGWLNEGTGSCTHLLLGGGPVNEAILEGLLQSSRVQHVWEGYGLSETLTHVATRELRSRDDLNSPFVPLPGITIGRNELGCAVIDAPSREVHNLVTNDCIEELAGGGFVWMGRADDVVNTGGVLVHPAEIERTFEQLMPNWVADWVAFGRSHTTLGDALVLRVHGTAPDGVDVDVMLAQWRTELKSILGPVKAPRFVEWAEVPRTERGKIERSLL